MTVHGSLDAGTEKKFLKFFWNPDLLGSLESRRAGDIETLQEAFLVTEQESDFFFLSS